MTPIHAPTSSGPFALLFHENLLLHLPFQSHHHVQVGVLGQEVDRRQRPVALERATQTPDYTLQTVHGKRAEVRFVSFSMGQVKFSLFLNRTGPSRIFVPLCGKAGDLIWLRDREEGNVIVGVEGVESVVEQFFQENGVEFVKGDLEGIKGTRFQVRDQPKPKAMSDLATLHDLPSEQRRPPDHLRL